MHVQMGFQRFWAYEKPDVALMSKTKSLVYFFAKVSHKDLVLLKVIWSGNVHALLEDL